MARRQADGIYAVPQLTGPCPGVVGLGKVEDRALALHGDRDLLADLVVSHLVGVWEPSVLYSMTWTALAKSRRQATAQERAVLIQEIAGVRQDMSATTRCPEPVQFGEREPFIVVLYVVADI